eukprot:g15878.t1
MQRITKAAPGKTGGMQLVTKAAPGKTGGMQLVTMKAASGKGQPLSSAAGPLANAAAADEPHQKKTPQQRAAHFDPFDGRRLLLLQRCPFQGTIPWNGCDFRLRSEKEAAAEIRRRKVAEWNAGSAARKADREAADRARMPPPTGPPPKKTQQGKKPEQAEKVSGAVEK